MVAIYPRNAPYETKLTEQALFDTVSFHTQPVQWILVSAFAFNSRRGIAVFSLALQTRKDNLGCFGNGLVTLKLWCDAAIVDMVDPLLAQNQLRDH